MAIATQSSQGDLVSTHLPRTMYPKAIARTMIPAVTVAKLKMDFASKAEDLVRFLVATAVS